MIKGVGYGKGCQAQARRFAVLRDLQYILRVQRGRSLMTEGKGILQELEDLGFALHVLRAVAVLEVGREFIPGEPRPQEIVGSGDMLHLRGKRAHALVVGTGNVQALRREVKLVLGRSEERRV